MVNLLRLIEAMTSVDRSGVTELGRRLEMPVAMVFRLLKVLEHCGYVEQLPASKQYRPAQHGGSIALVREGDEIDIDVARRVVDLHVAELELARRLEHWSPIPARYEAGVFATYATLVSSASEGAVTRPSHGAQSPP
jgi:DNA-binding IclR family transcriptional regulator